MRWALDQCLGTPEVGHVIVVAPGTHLTQVRDLIGPGESARIDVVPGGANRAASVRAGLSRLRTDDGVVLVHDAARCLAPPELFSAVIRAVRAGHGAVVPGLSVTDTIKRIDDQGRVVETLDRSVLRAIQTPQGFVREVLLHAHSQDTDATDDAGLVERSGAPVRVIDGDPRAFKITCPPDIVAAEYALRSDWPTRQGHPGRPR